MTIADRRRALIGAAKKEEPNGLLPGTGYGNGSSDISVNDNGDLVLTSLGGGAVNKMMLPFIRPIPVHNGDSIRLKISKKSGSANQVYGDALLNDSLELADNKVFYWSKENVADITITSTNDLNASYIAIIARTNVVTGPGTYALQLYINGEEQFG